MPWSLVAPGGEVDVLELEVFLVQARCRRIARPFPRADVREVLVVAFGFALGALMLLAEVAPAALLAVQRVAAHELAELEEVGDTAGLFERLVERRLFAEHAHVLPELFADRGNLGNRLLEALLGAGHAAVVPEHL